MLSRLAVFSALGAVLFFLSAAPPVPVGEQGNASCRRDYPAKGRMAAAFFDMIDGGTCWSCPKGFKRTAASVKARNACVGNKRATKVGNYGCKRKYGGGAFFDPRKGGECWTCPRGYKRTLEAVTSAKACSKGIFGPFSRATRKGKNGCDRGFKDPIDGGTCWTCPRGSKRTVFSVKSAKACEVVSRANSRGKDLGRKRASSRDKAKMQNFAQKFSNSNTAMLTELNKIYKLANGKLKRVFQGKALENAVKTGNYRPIWNKVKSDMIPILRTVLAIQRRQRVNARNIFNVLSFSVSAEAAAVVGGSTTQGILIDFTNINSVQVRGFVEYGAVITTGVGLGVGVTVGFSKEMGCGAGFGLSASVGIGKVAAVGAGVSIDPNLPCRKNWLDLITLDAVEGFSIGVSAGVGIAPPVTVSAAFSSTIVWKGKLRRDCTDCGKQGLRPCSVIERFPSCNTGLYERCGKCVRF